MKMVVVSDIFGRTAPLEQLCRNLGSEISMVDPYGGKEMGFADEHAAYTYFMQHVGIDRYAEHLSICLSSFTRPSLLIGFSVGASACWKLSATLEVEKVPQVIGFYGSQIRSMTEVEPQVPVELIFPAEEEGFSVTHLMDELSDTKNLNCHRSSYRHGFMNRLSVNYQDDGCQSYLTWLQRQQNHL